MVVRIHLLLAVLLSVTPVATFAAEDTEALIARLEAEIPDLMNSERVPGLSMVLIRQHRIVWTGCFGVRVAGEPAKVDPETVFEAASMSKPLFSYAVLKLVEAGKFDLDRPLDAYLPEPYLPDQPLAGRITGRMVMLHRTGMPNWRNGGWRSGGPLALQKEPDSCFTYSGEGYTYLQTAIEQLTQRPLAAWMQDALLNPLGMTHSGYEWQDRWGADSAGGHDKDGKFKTGRRFYALGNAAFSLYTTPTDYAKFLLEMMDRDRSAQHSLNAELLAQMTSLQTTPEPDVPRSRRSLGWVVDADADGGWVNHSGSNGSGFQGNSRFHVERQSGAVIMTNSSNGRNVWEAILKIIDDFPSEAAAASPPIEPRDPQSSLTWGAESRTIRYEYRLINPTTEPATEVEVFVPLPLETPRQQIHYLHLPPSPTGEVITDKHGQHLVRYTVDRLEPSQCLELGFVVGMTLQNMRWKEPGPKAFEESVELSPEAKALYLRSEANYSMESERMQAVAASVTAGANTDFEKLTRIHDHVINAIRYVRDGHWDPAEVVLAQGTGSCSEYNYVLSGLCRLAGLPTRCVGGSTNGFRELPTTDTVYHRWTEIFLSGYGWFPVDCSRDANPIRGKRSHFGRVYTDAVVWCRQAGGDDDTLGWDYRAKAHVRGDDPGVEESHRTRWFAAYSEAEVQAAYDWFLNGKGDRPQPDLLECAVLRWEQGGTDRRLKLIAGLAEAGRDEGLRRAAMLPESDEVREACLEGLCTTGELAAVLLEESRDAGSFGKWFNDHEKRLAWAGGRCSLSEDMKPEDIAVTTASPAEIWLDLAQQAVSRLRLAAGPDESTTLALMPIADQTSAGLGEFRDEIHSAIQQQIAREHKVQFIDEQRLDRWMQAEGPGSGEYWILATEERAGMPADLQPDYILVPVLITSQEEEAGLYRLDLKKLERKNCKYTSTVAQVRRSCCAGE